MATVKLEIPNARQTLAQSASATEINALERGLWSLRGKLTFAPGKIRVRAASLRTRESRLYFVNPHPMSPVD
jgi:hypothetical protein